ncbi:transcription initiation factor TFIID subunit 7-like [Aplochiton taeniatus]
MQSKKTKITSKLKVGKVGSKNKEDAPHELEGQFVLRLPMEYASTVRRIAQSSSMNLKDRLTIELHADGRHGIVRVDRVPLACKLVDLPCILESLKTVDKKTFYKTADVCQMLVCTLDGDLYPPLEEPTGSTDPKNKKKDKDKDKNKKFVWNHGITCPLKNTRKRRFRKTAKKKYIESPDVEKEVKRLLSTDAEAVGVRWEVIAEDETKEADNHGTLANLDSSPGTSGHKMGHGSSAQRDELREIFNDISSSSEDEEDEGDRHEEDDDLNIMDTEDDLVRQLQDKLNVSDAARDESDGNSQIAMSADSSVHLCHITPGCQSEGTLVLPGSPVSPVLSTAPALLMSPT